MTLKEMKTKVLALIEELNPEHEALTEDPDIKAKINDVINQILFELTRIKKIPKYVEMSVGEGDKIEFSDIEDACGYEVFQVSLIRGVDYEAKASGTVFKIRESGTAEIDLFVYPEKITSKTKDSYEFEVSADVLEIMPYGIAADLLKSDVSAEYGAVYSQRYENMKQMLDPRYQLGSIYIEGGVSI